MARKLRIEYPGATYHTYARGNEQRPIFYSDDDCLLFLDLLSETLTRFSWECLAFCLMDNHFHLVVRTLKATLSRGMQWLNGTYSQKFNRKHKRVGHLFQGRFKDTLVQDGAHLNVVSRYVVLNPVRAEMVGSPEQYRWSSYGDTAGLSSRFEFFNPDCILSNFGAHRDAAIQEYQSYVLGGIGAKRPHIYVPIFGDEDFVSEKIMEYGQNEQNLEFPIEQRQLTPPTLSSLIPFAEKRGGEDIQARNLGIVQAACSYGYKQTDIAQFVGLHYSHVSKIIAAARKEDMKPKAKM